MKNREEKIKELKEKGYDPVWIWEEGPNEEDLDHSHPFDTRLVILNGEIKVKLGERSTVLKTGDEIDISRGKIHYAITVKDGCVYIVAEKH